jgi:hypothetical protein
MATLTGLGATQTRWDVKRLISNGSLFLVWYDIMVHQSAVSPTKFIRVISVDSDAVESTEYESVFDSWLCGSFSLNCKPRLLPLRRLLCVSSSCPRVNCSKANCLTPVPHNTNISNTVTHVHIFKISFPRRKHENLHYKSQIFHCFHFYSTSARLCATWVNVHWELYTLHISTGSHAVS